MIRLTTNKVERTVSGGEYILRLTTDLEQAEEAEDFLARNKGKDLDITITRKSARRSLSANGYLWTLCEGIARKTEQTKTEVYLELIRSAGYVQVAMLPAADAETFVATWSRKGLGYFAEELACHYPGAREFAFYTGSSAYSAAQMSRLLEEAEAEAREQGVPLRDAEEVKEMIDKWR